MEEQIIAYIVGVTWIAPNGCYHDKLSTAKPQSIFLTLGFLGAEPEMMTEEGLSGEICKGVKEAG